MISLSISRRNLLGLVPFFCAVPALAQAKPYEARLFYAGFDGVRHMGGLQFKMAPGWKTYWRVPGAGGIPPAMDATGDNIAGFSFDCPLPHRISGGDGESIGYKDEVVFPWTLTPQDASRPVEAALSAFAGVCETICIPVPVRESFALKPAAMATRETALLAQWQARVPAPADVVESARAGEEEGHVFVDISLKQPATDMFVEGSSLHFFAGPLWRDEGRTARVVVHGAKAAGELHGRQLRITLDVNGGGLEQSVTVG